MEQNNHHNHRNNAALRQTIKNAIEAIGRGFDVNYDTRLLYCKSARLIELDGNTSDLSVLDAFPAPGPSSNIESSTIDRSELDGVRGPGVERDIEGSMGDLSVLDGNGGPGVGRDMEGSMRDLSVLDGNGGPGVERDMGAVLEGICGPGVSRDIEWRWEGERRESTGACSYYEMAEIFNRRAELLGNIPLGSFNAGFSFTGSSKIDSKSTKNLAIDGKIIPLCKIHLSKNNLLLKDEIVRAVPASWDPLSLSRFIETYGTHIVTSVTVGGKDVIYMKQHVSSSLSSEEIQNYIQDIADHRFSDNERSGPIRIKETDSGSKSFNSQGVYPHPPNPPYISAKEDVTVIFIRRGGNDLVQSHSEWAQTVSEAPDVVEMTFLPLASLLEGLPGKDHLVRAINLYLEYKPPIEELRYFLEFQLNRVWAPLREEENPLRPRKEPICPSLQFSIMSKKLYISQEQVSVGRKPVTGLKLSLSGPKQNRLSIHLQHLLTLPKILRPYWDPQIPIGSSKWVGPEEQDSRWFEPVKWNNFSHVSTAPIQFPETLISEGVWVVTGAQLGVWDFGVRNVLFMRLLFCRVPMCTVRRSLWEARESGEETKTGETGRLGLGRFVDERERSRGPEDLPGHWVVTSGKLGVDKGRICLRVKYSLLNY